MRVPFNEIKVQGMEQIQAPFQSGNWFILPDASSISTLSTGTVESTGLQEHEACTRGLFLRNMYWAGTYGCMLQHCLGLKSVSHYSSSMRDEFSDGMFDSIRVCCINSGDVGEKALYSTSPDGEDLVLHWLRKQVPELTKPIDFVHEAYSSMLKLLALTDFKPHPKALKAVQEYIQGFESRFKQFKLQVEQDEVWLSNPYKEANDWTLFRSMVYGGNEPVEWGTYFDDCEYAGAVRQGNVQRSVVCTGKSMFDTLQVLNLFYSNSQMAPIGYGFQDGNPMIILGKFTPNGKLATQAVRVGRYFNQYEQACDLRPLIDDLKILNNQANEYLCVTEREWHDAYNGGVSSCMAEFFWEDSPVRIYATTSHGLPDNNLRLFIQYTGELFGDDFKVVCRAIVNVRTMKYVRAYGNNSDAALRAAGYERDTACLKGCALAKIRNSDGYWLMVYSDGDADQVNDHGDHWVLVNSNGDYGADTAGGYLEEDSEEVEETFLCDHCDAYVPDYEQDSVETSYGYECWCTSCRSGDATIVNRPSRFHTGDVCCWVSNELLIQEEEEDAEEDEEDAA